MKPQMASKDMNVLKHLLKNCFRKPLQKEKFRTSSRFVKALVKREKNPLFYTPLRNTVVNTQNICQDMPEFSLNRLKTENYCLLCTYIQENYLFNW